MKYSQSVHISEDFKHWLEQHSEEYDLGETFHTDYLLNLLEKNTENNCEKYNLKDTNKNNYCFKNTFEDFLEELHDIENKSSLYVLNQGNLKTCNFEMHSNRRLSFRVNNSIHCIEPIQPCLPPNSIRAQGLLHDSTSEALKKKMDDYFAAWFYDNPTDILGFGFSWNKPEESKNFDTGNRINFYNKQNLLASNCNERLYERNADINKLISKFDANVEDIWKTSSQSDPLLNVKYKTLISQNIISNPYVHYGSNVVWSLEEKGSIKTELQDRSFPLYKASFSHWNRISSPVFSNTYGDLDSMLNAFNATLSNIQKWSAGDSHGYDEQANKLPKHKTCGFSEVVLPQKTDVSLRNDVELQSHGNQSCQEEEDDLLTSTKTHFRPIRIEEFGSSQTGIYADGTTFAIPNDLEKVSFKRSESGMLYLEAEADTPRKYMEFKEKDCCGTKKDGEKVFSVVEFVPKFRVRQSNEKCVQTEEIDEEPIVPFVNDTDCESLSCDSEENEFFFPGDIELAQNIVNAIEEESMDKEEKNDYVDKVDTLQIFPYQSPEFKSCICNEENDWNQNPVEDSMKKKEWSQIWESQSTCENCQKNAEKLSTNDKFRFREELIQEGEQLLLDLSSLQQMYSTSNWDDNDSSDFNDNEIENLGEEHSKEEYALSEMEYPGKGAWWSMLIAKEEPVKNGIDMRCLWKKEKLLENKKKFNEKIELSYITDVKQTERKRRNSSSQKAYNLYLERECRRALCKLAHCDPKIPCPYYVDASCKKGESYPLFHGVQRPLSL